MKLIDADKLPVQKIYHVDEAGYGATFYMVDIEDIKAAPRITYTDIVPHGRWIMHDDELGLSCECSVCHIETCGDSPYCPNCGARMIGEKK